MKFTNGDDILELDIKGAPETRTICLDTYARAKTYVGKCTLINMIYMIRHRCHIIYTKKFDDIPPAINVQMQCSMYDVINYLRLLIDTGLYSTKQYHFHYYYCDASVLYCMKRIMKYALKYASWKSREKVDTEYKFGDTTFYKNRSFILAHFYIDNYCDNVYASKKVSLNQNVQDGCEFIYDSLSKWSYPKMNCIFFRHIILSIISGVVSTIVSYFEKYYVKRLFRNSEIKYVGKMKIPQ